MSRCLRVAATLTFCLPIALHAQKIETQPKLYSLSPEYRATQAAALQAQRKLMLSFADSMPERLYRDKVTPVQRDFAGQLHHAVSSAMFIAFGYIRGGRPPAADTGAIFNTRAGMKSYINASYDWLDALLKCQTVADRVERFKFFNGQFMPRWQLWDELNQHTIWTAGQVVANFRKNGMAPPSFLFF
jgi:hypothetical protein